MAAVTYIQNDAVREATYKKSVKQLLKKTQELSVLCDVDACTIVYSPYDTNPVSWPADRDVATQLVKKFKESPDIINPARNLTQETFLRQRVTKYEEKIASTKERNINSDIENVMLDLLAGRPVEQVPIGNVDALMSIIEDRMMTMQRQISVLEGTGNSKCSSCFNSIQPTSK